LAGQEKKRKHFHGLYRLSKDSLVGLPPTPLEEWQEDEDHHRIERGTADGEQGGSRISWIVDSEVDELRAKQCQHFVLQHPIQDPFSVDEPTDKRDLVGLEEGEPSYEP